MKKFKKFCKEHWEIIFFGVIAIGTGVIIVLTHEESKQSKDFTDSNYVPDLPTFQDLGFFQMSEEEAEEIVNSYSDEEYAIAMKLYGWTMEEAKQSVREIGQLFD